MSSYRIENNPPASDADIARVESEIGASIPDCWREFLKKRDGFQVYQTIGYQRERWEQKRYMFATTGTHIQHKIADELKAKSLIDSFGGEIVATTERVSEYLLYIAEDEDRSDGVKHDPRMMDGLIAIGADDDRDHERFTYWMFARADASAVYSVEQPLPNYPSGYTYPAPIREQLKKPAYTFADFLKMMDVIP